MNEIVECYVRLDSGTVRLPVNGTATPLSVRPYGVLARITFSVQSPPAPCPEPIDAASIAQPTIEVTGVRVGSYIDDSYFYLGTVDLAEGDVHVFYRVVN